MRSKYILPMALILAGFPALADNASIQLEQCYAKAVSRDAKYDCFGVAVEACRAVTEEADLVACVGHEAQIWHRLAIREYEAGLESAAQLGADTAGDSGGATLQVDDLKSYFDQLTVARDRKCAIEARASQSAGMSELLGRNTCEMRENARMAIRLLAAREKMK